MNLTDKHVKNEMEFCRMFPSEILNFDPDSHLRQPFSYYDEIGEEKTAYQVEMKPFSGLLY